MTRVGVIGALGKMGTAVCEVVEAADDLDLVARIDEGDDPTALEGAEVAVDFTSPSAVMGNVIWCIEHGVSVVAGTSGFTDDRLRTIEQRLGTSTDVAVMVVPNFSIGAVLMMRFAAEAARFFESVEIVELHHPTKADAPSGTARRTAELVSAARTGAGVGSMPDATVDELVGARGALVADIPVHSVRIRGLVAHQEVILGGRGETLTIRHDSIERESFMPGVLAAIRAMAGRRGLTVGLDSVLGLG